MSSWWTTAGSSWRPNRGPQRSMETGPTANGNGHHDGIGPTVELVLGNGQVPANGNGHAPVPVNGNGVNGHHDEDPEPLQSTFSFEEFIAEPVRPKGRNPQVANAPSPCPSSNGALEQEREKETVGAGR